MNGHSLRQTRLFFPTILSVSWFLLHPTTFTAVPSIHLHLPLTNFFFPSLPPRPTSNNAKAANKTQLPAYYPSPSFITTSYMCPSSLLQPFSSLLLANLFCSPFFLIFCLTWKAKPMGWGRLNASFCPTHMTLMCSWTLFKPSMTVYDNTSTF